MDAVLDIQRDHEKLIGSVMSLLAIDGTLIFSNNFRNFSMSEGVKDTYRVEDITDKTFDPDFQRNKKIHNCWLINHHE
jgi:23S rRNA (guanine2445-N2)-methyltransferase / 23S rRNA (guanine2069-N7)-methyltransferase